MTPARGVTTLDEEDITLLILSRPASESEPEPCIVVTPLAGVMAGGRASWLVGGRHGWWAGVMAGGRGAWRGGGRHGWCAGVMAGGRASCGREATVQKKETHPIGLIGPIRLIRPIGLIGL